MTIYEYWQMLPPEIVTAIIAAIGALILAVIGFVVWLVRFLPRFIERQLKKSEVQANAKITEAQTRWELERLEIQNQLDQTQSNRELMRLQISEQEQNRAALIKIIDSMREDGQKRDKLHSEFLRETTESYRGIQANTAATLELLKTHQDHDEAMSIGQRKVIDQNDKTHERLSEMMNVLSSLSLKLESIAVGRVSDKKVLDEIKDAIEKVQASMKRLEDTTQPIPSLIESIKAPVVTTTESHKDDTIKLPEIDEKKEETK